MQKWVRNILSHLTLLLTAVVAAATTVVLASVPLLVLRKASGRGLYSLYVGVAVTALYAGSAEQWILPLTMIAVLVAFFVEAKKLHCTDYHSGLIAVLATSGLTALALGIYIQVTDFDLLAYLDGRIHVFLGQLKEVQPELVMDPDKLSAQIPSVIVILQLVSLWLGLLGEKYFAHKGVLARWFHWTEEQQKQVASHKLSNFKLPDYFVWIAIPALAIAFLDLDNDVITYVGLNILNVLVLAYFFQGLSIVASFFKKHQTGIFWQVFWYLFLVIQMFLLVSSLGFADYWMDFRSKIRKKPAKTA